MYAQGTGVEVLRQQITQIVAQRQELRSTGASRDSLEENRRRLADSQSKLARALIAQHGPQAV